MNGLDSSSAPDRADSECLPQIQLDQFLPPTSLFATLGSLFIAGTIGTAFLLSAVIKYNTTVKAQATVRPLGEIRHVEAATAGAVKKIEVKENQEVVQGDVIATLDDSRLQTQKRQLQQSLRNSQQQLTQITLRPSLIEVASTLLIVSSAKSRVTFHSLSRLTLSTSEPILSNAAHPGRGKPYEG